MEVSNKLAFSAHRLCLLMSSKHLIQDLQPYSCLELECSQSSQAFQNRDEWIDHLKNNHSMGPEWNPVWCYLCQQFTEGKMVNVCSHFADHLEDIALAASPLDATSDAGSEADSMKSQGVVAETIELLHAFNNETTLNEKEESPMNPIFPPGTTDLDSLLRKPAYGYHRAREVKLEACDAWKQLREFARALEKIQETPMNAASTGLPAETHEQQWIWFHFDLKPTNVIIRNDDTWLLTTDRTPRAKNDGGTNAYAPPETFNNNERQFNRRYYVWSLGCLILEVAAFVVLGYEGLTGPSGLDEVRREQDGWSKLRDSRFWYRISAGAEPEVKPAILKFMEHLSDSVRDRGCNKLSRQFLTEIMQLIELMLQPVVRSRIGIGEVIQRLEVSITQSLGRAEEGDLLQVVPGPNERDIGAPGLGQVQLRNWNLISKQWHGSVLHVFEDKRGNLRFRTAANNRSFQNETALARQRDAVLPYYAFWRHEIPQADEAWLGFCSIDSTGVPEYDSILYGFYRLTDSWFVQSRLTYQNIEASFSLRSVQVHKHVKVGRKAMKIIAHDFQSKTNYDGTQSSRLNARLNEETDFDGRDLGPATIQLWKEEEEVPESVEREGNESLMLKSTSTLSRRVVIYLHRYKCILTIRMDINWMARMQDEDPHVMHFQPTVPDRDPHFAVSLIQPTSGKVAGIPLCPQMLRKIEAYSHFETEKIILHFPIDETPKGFNRVYRTIKQAWELEKYYWDWSSRDGS
jgi:serine/threonine protein kinase